MTIRMLTKKEMEAVVGGVNCDNPYCTKDNGNTHAEHGKNGRK